MGSVMNRATESQTANQKKKSPGVSSRMLNNVALWLNELGYHLSAGQASGGADNGGGAGGTTQAVDTLSEQEFEFLAEREHQAWIRLRKSEGWVSGEKKDEQVKTTPYFVPYAELSEEIKDLDRVRITRALDHVKHLGFRLYRDPNNSANPARL